MKLFRPQAHVVLIGHTHYPGVWRRSGRLIVNTGSFLNYMGAQAAIIENDRLEVRLVNQRNGNFALGKLKEVFKIPKGEEDNTNTGTIGFASQSCATTAVSA
jgi:hypothetical protein